MIFFLAEETFNTSTAIFFNINLLSKIPDNKEGLIKIKRIKGKCRNNSPKWSRRATMIIIEIQISYNDLN